MTAPMPGPRSSLAAFADRLASSRWRLLALVLITLGIPLASLYALRGPRGVLLGVGAIVGSITLLAAFSRPFVTLAVSLVVFFSGLDLYLPGPVALGLLGIVAFRTLFDVLGDRTLDWGSPTFRISLTLLLAIALTSLLVARSFDEALRPMRHILWGSLFLVTIAVQADRTWRLRALMAASAMAFAASVLVLLYRILSSGSLVLLQPTGEHRVGVGDPNYTAVVACAFLVPLAHVLGQVQIWARLVLSPLVLLHVLAVILSASRMGMALLAMTLLVLVLRARQARPFALLGLVGLGVVLLNLPAKYWIRFTDLGQLGGILIDRSLRLRQHALEVGWQLFVEHPWLGVGLGNFPAESPRYMSVPLWAHNTYLDVAATLGIFGLAAFLVWELAALSMLYRSYRLWGIAGRRRDQSLAFSLGMSLVLIYAGAVTLDLAFNPLVWVFMGLAVAARRIAETGAP